MSKGLQYPVKKTFKYQGKTYRRGEFWTPLGGMFDKQIIEQEDVVGKPEIISRKEVGKQAQLRFKRLAGGGW